MVVGFISVSVATEAHSLLKPVRFGKIGSVCVTPSWQGHGIGRQLMSLAQQWVAERGGDEVRLHVWKFNAKALRLYEELGYEVRSHTLAKAVRSAAQPLQTVNDLRFTEIDAATGSAEVAGFLVAHAWPHHSQTRLSLAAASHVALGPLDEVRAFWITDKGHRIGLIRLLDLDDVEDGSAQFDLRLAEPARGRGVGTLAVSWLTDKLFSDYPLLHRIEATTRFDNLAMRRTLEANKYRLEGRLRETWPAEDGARHDTALYGRLRSDA